MDHSHHFDDHPAPPEYHHAAYHNVGIHSADDAQDTLDHDHTNGSMDYEPPSPSYPYPDDQQPPDAEPLDGQDEHLDLNKDPRHVSEIYSHDAVTGHALDHDNSIISEYLRSRDPDWDQLPPRTEHLKLLDLPLDVLRLIVKEVRAAPS